MNDRQLNRAMEALGLRQLDVAQMFNHTPRQVRRWQKGDADVPVAEAVLLRLMDWGIVDRQLIEDAKTKVKR